MAPIEIVGKMKKMYTNAAKTLIKRVTHLHTLQQINES
jgi:hypothetical protein